MAGIDQTWDRPGQDLVPDRPVLFVIVHLPVEKSRQADQEETNPTKQLRGLMSRGMPVREKKNRPAGAVEPAPAGAGTVEKRTQPRTCSDPGAEVFRFDDPYWEEAFDSYHDPTLRICRCC